MAQEIVHWCDRHFDRDERVIGSTRVVSLDGMPAELELCADCWTELTTELAKQVAEHGRTLDLEDMTERLQQRVPREDRRRRVECPIEGCTTRLYRESFRNHLADMHNTSLTAIESGLGQTLEGKPLTHWCDVEGCGAGFVNVMGLAAHQRSTHGIEGTSKAAKQTQQPTKKAPAKRASKSKASST
jgi:hypothetical protein